MSTPTRVHARPCRVVQVVYCKLVKCEQQTSVVSGSDTPPQDWNQPNWCAVKVCSKERPARRGLQGAGASADLNAWLWVLHATQAPHDEQNRICAVAIRGFIWQELHHTYSLVQIQNVKYALYASGWPNLYSKDFCRLKDELHKVRGNVSRQAAAHAYMTGRRRCRPNTCNPFAQAMMSITTSVLWSLTKLCI